MRWLYIVRAGTCREREVISLLTAVSTHEEHHFPVSYEGLVTSKSYYHFRDPLASLRWSKSNPNTIWLASLEDHPSKPLDGLTTLFSSVFYLLLSRDGEGICKPFNALGERVDSVIVSNSPFFSAHSADLVASIYWNLFSVASSSLLIIPLMTGINNNLCWLKTGSRLQ